MAKRAKSRIFLVSPNDLSSATCVGKMTENDRIFLITDEAPELKENIITFLNGRDSILGTAPETIYHRLVDECDGSENIYFIGPEMQELYEELYEKLLPACSGIGCNKTFGVAHVRLKRRQVEAEIPYIEALLSGMGSEENTLEGSIKETEVLPDVPKKHETHARSEDDARWEDTRNPDTSKKDTKKKKAKIKQEQITHSDSSQKAAGESNNSSISMDIADVERSKAVCVAAFRDRIRRHISAEISTEISNEQCFQFMINALKSDTLSDFTESLMCTGFKPLKLSETGYIKLKEESAYYMKVCNVLYGGDIWNY